MAYKINPDVCVSCGVCKENCPVECIKEADGKMVINADECVDCGTCAANCPVNAIDPA
jgi:NAD-dependent dihydropyrimidine dehydrogenase PreA subunit